MFSYFTIIDEKDFSGATSYSEEIFTFGAGTAQKKAGPRLSSAGIGFYSVVMQQTISEP